MLARAFEAAVPAAWVTGDEIYGQDGKLRRWLHEQQRAYVLAVSRAHTVWAPDSWTQQRVETLLREVPAQSWRRLSVGEGSKGPRVYD